MEIKKYRLKTKEEQQANGQYTCLQDSCTIGFHSLQSVVLPTGLHVKKTSLHVGGILDPQFSHSSCVHQPINDGGRLLHTEGD